MDSGKSKIITEESSNVCHDENVNEGNFISLSFVFSFLISSNFNFRMNQKNLAFCMKKWRKLKKIRPDLQTKKEVSSK
jgi:hypothetical protein